MGSCAVWQAGDACQVTASHALGGEAKCLLLLGCPLHKSVWGKQASTVLANVVWSFHAQSQKTNLVTLAMDVCKIDLCMLFKRDSRCRHDGTESGPQKKGR